MLKKSYIQKVEEKLTITKSIYEQIITLYQITNAPSYEDFYEMAIGNKNEYYWINYTKPSGADKGIEASMLLMPFISQVLSKKYKMKTHKLPKEEEHTEIFVPGKELIYR